MKNRIVHFEIHASDPERAAKFYQEALGWEIKRWEGIDVGGDYWMVMTDEMGSKEPGINGGLMIRKGATPVEGQAVNAYVCTAQVESIDTTIEKVIAAGGTEAVAKYNLGGMAWQAYFKDTEGNIFGLHEAIKKAE